mmetsp:Transcript_17309/g.35585  ORF Transcript_17309/g.35585 Transcript_17309/m.35585 type:complete len:322 (-) Transcript_17309:519-1484(-)
MARRFRYNHTPPCRSNQRHAVLMLVALWVTCCSASAVFVSADDYTVAEGNQSLLVALGCFWCAEQAFEQYAPGVVEAVSGYAGGTNENPTYRNHPGHTEVVLVEYDPTRTSYELLVNYAYRNMDPFDGTGQFCDKGTSYYPAIFYRTEDERVAAETVLEEILELNPDWSEESIAAPILERPRFWKAEDYHQDYYVTNPHNYGYYKNACGRPKRLKEVWGETVYDCYHDKYHTCFAVDGSGTNNTTDGYDVTDALSGEDDTDNESSSVSGTVLNANGEVVGAESNAKNAPEEKAPIMPRWAIILVWVLGGLVAFVLALVYAC